MAASPLCASWFAPAAVAAIAPHGAWPTSTAVRVHPLCRRSTSPAPLRIQDRTRVPLRMRVPFHSRCHRHPIRSKHRHPFNADDKEVRKKYGEFLCLMAWHEAPDMFPVERGEISDYMIKIASSRANDKDVNNKVMALVVCAEAQKALDLASRVMDLMTMASLHLGTPEFSQDTINQMVRPYAPIFLNVAKDAYNKRIDMDTVLSFLDALRDLGTICHILVQDTVAMLKDDRLEKFLNSNMDTHSIKFEKRMNNLKEKILASAIEATGNKHTLVMGTLGDGMKRAQSYVVKLILERREVLDYLFLAQAASTTKASRKNR